MILLFRGLGFVLVAIALLAIIIGHGMVWYQDGFWATTDLLSPNNIVNTLAMAALLAPGFFALWLADRLSKRKT